MARKKITTIDNQKERKMIARVQEPNTDNYTKLNSDWQGRILHFKEETGIFPNDSYIRIWRNEQFESYPPHWHNALEIIIPMENDYSVEIGSVKYDLSPGDILFIPAGESHSITAPEFGKRYIMLFGIGSMSKIRGYNGMHSVIEQNVHITQDKTPQIYNAVYEKLMVIVNEYFNSTEFSEFSIYSSLFEILVVIARYNLKTMDENGARNFSRKKHAQRFKDVLDYIDMHYSEPLTLENAASHSGFSKYHFSRLFKEYTNYNFYDYLVFRRIKAAEALLCQGNISITEVALQSGFASISTFNRSFKKLKGITPGEFRAQYTNRN